MKSLLALAILLLVSVPSGASAESWNLVQSEPFRVVGDVGHQDLALAARTLEQFRRSVLGLFPERRASSSRSLTVIVIGGRGIGRCYAGGADNVGGFYRRGTYEDFIVMRSGSVGGPSLQTVLHEYQHAITSSSEQPETGYAEVAGRLGMTEGAVKVAVHRLRRQFRDLVHDEIAQTVDSPDDIEDEMRYLWAAVGPGDTRRRVAHRGPARSQ